MLRLNLEYEVLEPRILFAADQTSQTGQTSDSTSATVEPVAVPPSPGDTHDLAPAVVSAPAVAPKDIVFISDAVEGYETLVAAYSAEHEVVVLDHTGDNLAQMASVLSGRSDLAAIHILSHGSSGDIALGTVDLNSQNISQYAEAIGKIGRALSADGDILFYGCNIAESVDGKMLVEKIASLSAADVAASVNKTGTNIGGDSVLEYTTGKIETPSLKLFETDWIGDLAAMSSPAVKFSFVYQLFNNGQADGFSANQTKPDIDPTPNSNASAGTNIISTGGLSFTASSRSTNTTTGLFQSDSTQGNDVTGTITFTGMACPLKSGPP